MERPPSHLSEPDPPALSLIIATLNEESALAATLEQLAITIERADMAIAPARVEVLVMDGGSTDSTFKVVRDWATPVSGGSGGSRQSQVTGVARGFPAPQWRPAPRPPEDLAVSVLRGLEAARSRYAIVMDGDGDHPPNLIPRILDNLMAGSGIVVASRYVGGAPSRPGMDAWRLAASRTACLMSRPFIGLHDGMSGYAGFDLSRVRLPDRAPQGFKIVAELVRHNRHITPMELAYAFGRRREGVSKFGGRAILHFLVQWTGWVLGSLRHRGRPGELDDKGALDRAGEGSSRQVY